MQARAVDEGPSSRGPPAERRDVVPARSSSLTEFEKAKKLRLLSRKHKTMDTPSLVKAYNDETGKTEQQLLAAWIHRYGELENKDHISDAIRELAELTKMNPRTDQDYILHKFIYNEIRNRLKQNRYPDRNVGKALHEALLWTHSDHFLNESLPKLTQNILSTLSASPQMYNAVFEDYEATFLALRQSIVRLRERSSSTLSWTAWQALRRTIREKRQTLKNSLKYYPVSFHFSLIEQGIESLDVIDRPFVAQLLQCAGCSSCSLTRLLRGSSASNSHRDASSMRRGTSAKSSQWYHLYCKLEEARLKTLRSGTDAKMFLPDYEELMDSQGAMEEGESRTALRFGIIHELCQLSLHGTDRVRSEMTEKLLELSKREVEVGHDWIKERVIFEALLEAVYRVHKKGNLRNETEKALRDLTAINSPLQEEVRVEWLGSATVEDKIRMQADEMTATWQRSLFGEIARQVGYIPFAVIRKNIEGLKDAYKTHSFTTVRADDSMGQG